MPLRMCINRAGFRAGRETTNAMPEKKSLKRASRAKHRGESPSTQAGEFVREEMDHIREGKHGARNAKQAIAIGLSKARRAGVKLPPPKPGNASPTVRKKAVRDLEKGKSSRKPNRNRSRAVTSALKREGRTAASSLALSRQAHAAAGKRTAAQRSASAKKAARTRAGSA
jgi:hypothetical protein